MLSVGSLIILTIGENTERYLMTGSGCQKMMDWAKCSFPKNTLTYTAVEKANIGTSAGRGVISKPYRRPQLVPIHCTVVD